MPMQSRCKPLSFWLDSIFHSLCIAVNDKVLGQQRIKPDGSSWNYQTFPSSLSPSVRDLVISYVSACSNDRITVVTRDRRVLAGSKTSFGLYMIPCLRIFQPWTPALGLGTEWPWEMESCSGVGKVLFSEILLWRQSLTTVPSASAPLLAGWNGLLRQW